MFDCNELARLPLNGLVDNSKATTYPTISKPYLQSRQKKAHTPQLFEHGVIVGHVNSASLPQRSVCTDGRVRQIERMQAKTVAINMILDVKVAG